MARIVFYLPLLARLVLCESVYLEPVDCRPAPLLPDAPLPLSEECEQTALHYMTITEPGSCFNYDQNGGCTKLDTVNPIAGNNCGVEICGAFGPMSCGLVAAAIQQLVSECTITLHRQLNINIDVIPWGRTRIRNATSSSGVKANNGFQEIFVTWRQPPPSRLDAAPNSTDLLSPMTPKKRQTAPWHIGGTDFYLQLVASHGDRFQEMNVNTSRHIAEEMVEDHQSTSADTHVSGEWPEQDNVIMELDFYAARRWNAQDFTDEDLSSISQEVGSFRNWEDSPEVFVAALFDNNGYMGIFVEQHNNVVASSHCKFCATSQELRTKWDTSLDNDPDTGAPYEIDALSEQAFSNLTVGVKPVTSSQVYKVVIGTGVYFLTYAPGYPQGQNGRFLLQFNAQAGFYAPENAYNCESTVVIDLGDDPTAKYVTEHVMEKQLLPRFLEFLLTGRNTDPDGTTHTGPDSQVIAYDLIAPGSTSLFQRDYTEWDPNAQALGLAGRPIDRVWETFGSADNAHNLLNCDSVLNAFKARVWAGTAPMSITLWEQNGFNQWDRWDSCERAYAAMGVINMVFYVFDYLNQGGGQTALSSALNELDEELGIFSDRASSVSNSPGQLPNLSVWLRDYLYGVLQPRIERVDVWVIGRINALRATWQIARANGNANAQHILDDIEGIAARVDDLVLYTANWPAALQPPKKRSELDSEAHSKALRRFRPVHAKNSDVVW